MSHPQFDYVEGQFRPTFAALLAEFETRSRAAVAGEPCFLDQRYGPAERQRFDFFPAHGQPKATLAYFHAGYWQSRDKSTFRFIAPAFTRRGLNVALVDYPLCPSVALAELIDAARASLPALRARSPALPLIASGHSAGGHIAVELASAVEGVIALSGIYDLAPLIATTLNRNLALDAESAAANSPLHRVPRAMPPALFIVGGDETSAFLNQSQCMHEAWFAAGNASQLIVAPGADHFSLLRAFTAEEGPLAEQVVAFITAVRTRHAFKG